VSARTSGDLPLEPFAHSEPTAVAELALDRPLQLTPPGGLPWSEHARDTLALVRVHGDPLDLIYLRRPPARLSPEEIAAEVWLRAGYAIRQHARSHGCGPSPNGPQELIEGWPGLDRCSDSASGPGLSVCVVIPTSRDGTQLARCLRSLQDLARPGLEVIVVGKGPDGGTTRSVVEAAAEHMPGLRYIPLSSGGRCVALNLGIASTTAEIISITDDDLVVDRDWIDRLTAPFAHSEVAAVTGLVLPFDLATPAQKWFELYAGFSHGLVRRRYDNQANRARDRLLYPYWGAVFGAGNNMAFRRRALVALGGFDTALGGGTPTQGGADVDIMTRVVLAGHAVEYEPRALVWHEHRRDEAALRRQLFTYGSGFTAVLTKAALRDPGFHVAALRSIPILARVIARRRLEAGDADRPRLPAELSRMERRGMVAGPRAYLRSAARARRQRPFLPYELGRDRPMRDTSDLKE
jgi:GT2 family glycosyltransferase